METESAYSTYWYKQTFKNIIYCYVWMCGIATFGLETRVFKKDDLN